MNNERNEYTFLWFIENYSYCWHKNEELLTSPQFTADGLEGTAWSLSLFPRGFTDKEKGNISLFLARSEFDDGPEDFPLHFELSVLAADGSALHSKELEHTFKREYGCGALKLVSTDEIFVCRKSEYLPQDILSVRVFFKIQRGEGNIQQVKEISARTRIGIERISFRQEVECFSSLEPNEKKTIQIRSPSKEGHTLSSSLYFSDDSCCENKIIMEITSSNTNQILSRCKLFLLDGSGKVIQCGDVGNRFDAIRKDIQKLPLSLTKTDILKRKNDYLPGDKLSLLCECIFSTGVEFQKIESTLHEFDFVGLDRISTYNKDIYAEKLSVCPSGLDDLKEIYSERLLTDMELKTTSKSFPVHKLLLCARSSVFKAMLTNDMREKNTDCIQVDDLENATVQQLLVFLYSDQLENLQWESAIKLYYAGDKYAIEKLKVMCASFLVKNLSISTASELLLLADTHNDIELKKVAEDFIFKHEEVFGSDEWRNLIETNPVLVSKTMCLKYMRVLGVTRLKMDQ